VLVAGAWLSCTRGAADGAGVLLTSVSPARISARGGDSLTVRGSGFTPTMSIRLGGEPVSALELVSPTEARFTAPPLFAGPASVAVDMAGAGFAGPQPTVEVLPLDLHFIEAPDYALPSKAGATIVGAAMGDFDGDGSIDLITCAPNTSCRFLTNDGRGNFTDTASPFDSDAGAPGDGGIGGGGGGDAGSPAIGLGLDPRFPSEILDVRALVAADFDGDGHLDLFVGVGTNGPGACYRNDGKATFTDAGFGAVPPDGDAVTSVAIGDLDGDGRPDLVVGNSTPDLAPFRVYLNAGTPGSGSIQLASAPLGTVPERDWIVTALALADLDGDGAIDLLVATPGAADGVELRLLLNHAGAFEEAPGRLPGGPAGAVTALASGDVDGDGDLDLVAVGAGQDRLLVNDGTGHFFDATAGTMPLDASKGTSVALVDLDRDRDLDLVIGNDGAETRVYLNDGAGRFVDHTPLLPIRADATVWVAIANVDGDADEDIVILNAAPTPARLYLSVEPPDAAH
jgi:hypothetical protein